MIQLSLEFLALSFFSKENLKIFFDEINYWKPRDWNFNEWCCKVEYSRARIEFCIEMPENKMTMEKIRDLLNDIDNWVPWELKNLSISQHKYTL